MKQTISLDHVNFSVKNLNESIKWYADVFGFETVEKGARGSRKFAIIRKGDFTLCMGENAKLLDGTADSNKVQINHFAFRISNIADWEEKIKTFGVTLLYGGVTDYPFSKSWYILDPSGHEIEIVFWNEEKLKFPTS